MSTEVQEINKIAQAILDPNTTHYVGIKLPARQVSGTETQRIAYAQAMAKVFYNDFVKEGCLLDSLSPLPVKPQYILLYWNRGTTHYVTIKADSDEKAKENAIDIVSLETDNPDAVYQLIKGHIIASDEN